MPIPTEYHGSSWFIDPEDRNLYRIVGSDITDESITMSELTDGEYGISSRSVYDASTGRFKWLLDPANATQLNVMADGQLIASRESAIEQANSPAVSASRRGVTASGELTLPSGRTIEAHIAPWTAGQGMRILVRELSEPGDEYRFRRVSLFDEAGTAIEPEIPPGFRYATPEEAIDRGVVAELIKFQTDDLREMVALGMVDENGEPITDTYEAAEYLAHQMSVTPSISSVLM